MASFQDSSRGPFQASSLAKWFHSAPHKDLQLEDTTTIFSPAEKSYREALYVLALFIASFGALLFLLIVIYYTCCYCACRQTRERRQNESCCCAKTSLQLQVFMLALICCGALTVGFIFNGKTSEGVDQFRNSVDDIQDDINYASTMGNQMEATLQNTKSDISVLYDDTRSAAVEIAITLSEMLINNLIFVNNQLPESVVNESGNVGDKVHRYDNYRWLATVILLSWCIFLCIFLFWIGCQVNGCILVMASMFCLLTVLFTWTVVGADVGVATGIGDFCVHPKQAIRKIKKGDAIVISYYMDCNGYDPFGKNLSELQADSKKVMDLIASVPVAPEYQYLKNRIVTDMTSVNNNLRLYQASFTCDKIHKEYMDAMDGLCEKTLNSLAIVILAVLVIAVFSGLLTCCTCPLWKHRRPYPTTYNDIRSPPDDVGNAVLWWPHDVDAESDRSFHQRHSDPNEQSPLIANQQHYPEYQGGNQAGNQVGDQVGNQANLNFIHVNYHGIPPRTEERQASGRHSF